MEIRDGSPLEVAELNDRAYGLERAWTGEPSIDVRWKVVDWGGEPVSCAAAIDVDDDVCVTAVATVPERQGSGLARIVICELLAEAGERGMSSASLQASRAGAPVYARLGFRDVGHTEMWEKREPV